MQPAQGFLLPGARRQQAPPVEIEHPQLAAVVDLQIVSVHVRMIDAAVVKIVDRRADRLPEFGAPWSFSYAIREWPYIRYPDGDDVRRIKRTVAAISRGRGARRAQIIGSHLRKHAPLDKRSRRVLAGPDVSIADEFANQAATQKVPQNELPRYITDVHRMAAAASSERSLHRLRMRPATRYKPGVGDLLDS